MFPLYIVMVIVNFFNYLVARINGEPIIKDPKAKENLYSIIENALNRYTKAEIKKSINRNREVYYRVVEAENEHQSIYGCCVELQMLGLHYSQKWLDWHLSVFTKGDYIRGTYAFDDPSGDNEDEVRNGLRQRVKFLAYLYAHPTVQATKKS